MNEYAQLTENILRSGRYNSYNELAEKLDISPRFLRYLRSGERVSKTKLTSLRRIWGGIKATRYDYVYIGLMEANKYFFGRTTSSIVKHTREQFESFMKDTFTIYEWKRYAKGTKLGFKKSDYELWVQIADSYKDELINRDEFLEGLKGVFL